MAGTRWSTTEVGYLIVLIDDNLTNDREWNDGLAEAMEAQGFHRNSHACRSKQASLTKEYKKPETTESLMKNGSGCLDLPDDLQAAMERGRVLLAQGVRKKTSKTKNKRARETEDDSDEDSTQEKRKKLNNGEKSTGPKPKAIYTADAAHRVHNIESASAQSDSDRSATESESEAIDTGKSRVVDTSSRRISHAEKLHPVLALWDQSHAQFRELFCEFIDDSSKISHLEHELAFCKGYINDLQQELLDKNLEIERLTQLTSSKPSAGSDTALPKKVRNGGKKDTGKRGLEHVAEESDSDGEKAGNMRGVTVMNDSELNGNHEKSRDAVEAGSPAVQSRQERATPSRAGSMGADVQGGEEHEKTREGTPNNVGTADSTTNQSG